MKIKIKKLLIAPLCAVIVIAGVATFAAFEAHVINVTAHIENALTVSPDSMGVEFGTVFPQEYFDDQTITIGLSDSFVAQDRVNEVNYKIVQKPKLWRDDFIDDVYPAHRSLGLVDPDNNGTKSISGGKLSLTVGDDVEDLFGPSEVASDWTAPRMVMVQGGNFTVETQIVNTSLPTQYYRSAGILAYGQDGDLVRLEVSNWTKWGMGDVVYMESQIGKVKDAKRYASITYADNIYLKMTRTGDEFKGYYSFDGDTWTEVDTNVPDGSGANSMINDLAGKTPMVGVSAVNSQEEPDGGFTANFEYVEMNGNYGDFCRFLSKMPQEEDGDVGVPSYYDDSATPICSTPSSEIATGKLDKSSNPADVSDTWTIDLKVPPIEGYVGQDWPDSCRDWTVPAEADYGCDLWIEVTGIDKP